MDRRILIVEPDPEKARELFNLFHLEHGNCSLEIAQSVTEALEKVQTINFHCVIMDINLPEMKGYEAIPLMKTINNAPPVIVTADKNTLEIETKVRKEGAYYYHIRSSNENELQLAVHSVFKKLGKVTNQHKVTQKPILLKRLQEKEKRRAANNNTDKLDKDFTIKEREFTYAERY